MDIRNISKAELEAISYNDIAYYLIKEDNETKSTPSLFREICNLLDMSDAEYEGLIADFYTSLTIDKRFLLKNGVWDLKENNVITPIIDEVDDEYDEDLEEVEDEEIEEEYDIDEDVIDDLGDEEVLDDDPELNELDELEIVDEDKELEE